MLASRAFTCYSFSMSLTERETEILKASAQGMTSNEVGRLLFLSPKTVKSHKSSIFAKLRCRNMTHAVVLAITLGLITLDGVELEQAANAT